MQRCFIPPDQWNTSTIPLPPTEQHHLLHVLRLQHGASIIAFDGQGRETETRLQLPADPSGQACLLIQTTKHVTPTAPPADWILVPAIIKGSRMDSLIEKATELGASQIMPIQTRRCVVKLDPKQAPAKVARWERIAISAAKQCGTPRLPLIHNPAELHDALTTLASRSIPVLQGSLQGNPQPFATVARQLITSNNNAIAILIGPEGDFTPEEYDQSRNAGCIPVSLGHLTLRAETATIFCLSVLQALRDEFHS